MKRKFVLFLAGACLFLTACAKKSAESSSELITEPVTEIQAVTEAETLPESETVPGTLPAESSNPEKIVGIWKGETDYRWFREDGSYVTMNYQGTFPEEIPIEVNENSVTLTLDGQPVVLTQTGTHVFDTLDGLYHDAGQEYQIFITGNMVYRYFAHDYPNAYEYDGQNLMLPWSENAMNCFVSGDTLEIEGEIFTRTHDLDDFLLN